MVVGYMLSVVCVVLNFQGVPEFSTEELNAARIQPYDQNPRYWQYNGEPVLLLGGSWQDNLFNHPHEMEKHLDVLVEAGGNYLRNVMGHRNNDNVFAFAEVETGVFDLEQWNEEYWRRFDYFIDQTYQRDIIVQIEVWATYDYHGDSTLDEATGYRPKGGWTYHPYNPENNINYTAEESGIRVANDFFASPPMLNDNAFIREYQHRYVDRILETTLRYPHVLYCMNNETNQPVAWGDYWVTYIQDKAREAGIGVETTDMRFSVDIRSEYNTHIFMQPEIYTFIEMSQNNHQQGQTHWDLLSYAWNKVADQPRPLNNTKVYSINAGDEGAIERFIRDIIGGCASARYHRPHPLEGADVHYQSSEWGLGLSPKSQATIKSTRLFTNAFDIFSATPDLSVLSDRDDNEAYSMVVPGEACAVYFTNGGTVTLSLEALGSPVSIQWIEIMRSAWLDPQVVEHDGSITLTTPGNGSWFALLTSR